MIDLDRILPGRGAKTLAGQYVSGIADAISPTQSERGRFARYRNDLVAFTKEELLVDHLTVDQERLLRAIIDHEVVVVMSATGTGKTFALACASLGLYKSRQEIQVYTAAAPPESNLKKLLWGEIKRFVQKHKLLFQGDKLTYLNLERAAKEFITGVTIPMGSTANPEEIEAKFSGKHQKNIVFFVDEGDAVPDPVYKGIDGCMSGGFARLAICFNPRVKTGEVWRMIRDNKAFVISMSALNHPNVITGEEVVPGAVTREKTVRRINEWCAYAGTIVEEEDLPSCFMLPDFLVGATCPRGDGDGEYLPLLPGYYKIVEQQFWYKVLGLFPPAVSSQLIHDDWIDAARSRWELYVAEHGINPPGGVQPKMALDVSDNGPDFNVASFLYGDWLAPLEKWNGVDPDRTADRATKMYKARNVRQCHVDAIGVGAGVAPKMGRAGCTGARGIKVSETSKGHSEDGEFKIVRDEAYWMLRKWFESGRAMIPSDKRLDEALRAMTYEVIGKNVVVLGKKAIKTKLGYSPDELESLMLHFAPSNTWFGGI